MSDAPGPDDENDTLGELYFKVQSDFDFTKHAGSLDATQEIVDVCPIRPEHKVLDVGCGVGMTPAWLAKTVGCHVVGIDKRPGMIDRATERAAREGVEDRVTLQVADALALPFDDDSFDVVMCESVLALVEDQPGLLREMLRVLKPGGRLGVTETTWMTLPSPELLGEVRRAMGHMEVHSPAGWRELIQDAGFDEVVVDAHAISVRGETVARARRYGLGHLLRVFGHMMTALLADPEYRAFLKRVKNEPKGILANWGYIVAVATKPDR